MGMYVKLDERNRLTLPKSAAVLFENGLVALKREKNRIILEPVERPFAKFKGRIKDKRSILRLKRKLDEDIEAGRWGV